MEPFAAGGEGGTVPGGRLRSRRRRSLLPVRSVRRCAAPAPPPSPVWGRGVTLSSTTKIRGRAAPAAVFVFCQGASAWAGLGDGGLPGVVAVRGFLGPGLLLSFSAVRPVVLQRPGCRTPPDALIQQRCMRLTGGLRVSFQYGGRGSALGPVALTGGRPRPTGSGAACFDRIKGAVSLVVTTRSRRVAAQPAGRLSVCAGSRGSVSGARRKIRLAKIPILT